MNSLPRQRLREAVARYGRTLSDKPHLCQALLNDLCGDYRGDIGLLVIAAREGVVSDLITSGSSVPRELLLRKHVKHLEKFHFTESAARWGVESWALALGLMSDDELSSPSITKSVADKILQRPEANVGRKGTARAVYISGAVAALMLTVAITMVVLKSEADQTTAAALAAQARAEQVARETEAAKEISERDAKNRIDDAKKAQEASEKKLSQLKQIQPRADLYTSRTAITDNGLTVYVTLQTHNLQSVQCVATAYIYDAEGNEVKSSSKNFMPTSADVSYDDFSIFIPSSFQYFAYGTYTYKVILKKWTGESLAESEEASLEN